MFMWLITGIAVLVISCLIRVLTRKQKSFEVQYKNGKWRRRLGDTFESALNLCKQDMWIIADTQFVVSKQKLPIDKIKATLRRMVERHPLLKARCIMEDGEYYFEELQDFELPFSVAEDTTWEPSHEKEMLKLYDRENAPLWRCVLLQNVQSPSFMEDDYEHQAVFIFGFHHSIMDATGGSHLFAELLDTLDGLCTGRIKEHDPIEKLPVPLPMAALLPELAYTWKLALLEIVFTNRIVLKLLSMVFKRYNPMIKKNIWTERFSREIDRNPSCEVKTCVLPIVFSREQTKTLLLKCKENRVTVQGFIQTVASIAIASLYDGGSITSDLCVPAGIGVTVSMRPLYPDKLMTNAVACYFSMTLCPLVATKDWMDKFWDLARDSTKVLHTDLKGNALKNLNVMRMACMILNGGIDIWPKNYERAENLFVFTNIGNCNFVNRSEAVAKVAARFLSTSEQRVGPVSQNAIATIDGRLCWAMNYFPHIVKPSVAQEFVDLIKDTLNEVLD